MPLSHWTTLSEETLGENPYWKYKHDRFRLPSGKEGDYFYKDGGSSSMIVPVLPDGRLVLVGQYRYLFDEDHLEFPCGYRSESESPMNAAVRELAEEAAYRAGEMTRLGAFATSSGSSNAVCEVFLARDLTPAYRKRDETEEFEIHHLTASELEEKIHRGEIMDGMTLAAWMLVKASKKL